MIVVSDTTPLNYLVLIGHINILNEIFSRVIIPRSVWEELHNPGTPELVRGWADSRPTWLEVRQASQKSIMTVGRLGAGEREAIALALELNADAILIDDRKGANESRKQGLITIGTLAIIVDASKRGLCDLNDAFRKLAQTNFRFPNAELLQELLRESKATKQLE